MAKKMKLATVLAKEYQNQTPAYPHIQPLSLSSTYIYPSVEEAQRTFEGKSEGTIYARWSHPNVEAVEQKLAALQTAKNATALCFSSGMSAISAVFEALCQPYDTIIMQGNVYGTSVDFANHLSSRLGIKVIFQDFKDEARLKIICEREEPVLLFAETPSNPTIQCYDLAKIATIAKQAKAKLVVDNTFATPLLQQPLLLGADVEIDSSTKFLNGHGTGLSGVVFSTDKKWIKNVLWKIRKLNGTILTPMDAWLLNLGLKTLPLRMKQHCTNAMAVAQFLEKHPKVTLVNYLGLKSHADHTLAKKQMTDFGGVLSFELKGGYRSALALLNKVKLCQLTASLGTTDTLIQHPASMSHYFVPKAQREQYGITDGLVRLSLGLEDVEDIIEDLTAALK